MTFKIFICVLSKKKIFICISFLKINLINLERLRMQKETTFKIFRYARVIIKHNGVKSKYKCLSLLNFSKDEQINDQ